MMATPQHFWILSPDCQSLLELSPGLFKNELKVVCLLEKYTVFYAKYSLFCQCLFLNSVRLIF